HRSHPRGDPRLLLAVPRHPRSARTPQHLAVRLAHPRMCRSPSGEPRPALHARLSEHRSEPGARHRDRQASAAMKRVRAALVFAGTLCLASCATRAPRTPERLYAAYMDALRRDDPSAAYALLSPELQATLPRAEFDARWKAQAAEHRAILAAREPNPPPIAYRGTTVHEGGRILVWAAAPGNKAFYVESGLPSQ